MTLEKFEQFVKERRFLKNVTVRTEEFYQDVRSALKRFYRQPEFTEEGLKEWVVNMRQAEVKPVSCNSYASGANAYLNWLFKQGLLATKLSVARQQTSKQNIQAFSPMQTRALIGWKPKGWYEQRLGTLVLLLLDTGMRIDEAFRLERREVDLENMLVRVRGKGDKYRLIPLSFEGRKALFRWLPQHAFQVVFPTRRGTKLAHRPNLRAFVGLCKRLGIEGPRCSFHTLRHTFALAYLRNGGDVFRLQRILGHTSLEMTRRYVDLQTEDLQAVHNRLSPLAV